MRVPHLGRRPLASAWMSGGFTLIELMVAISVLALIAILSWRGLDGMSRAQLQTQSRADTIVATQSSLGQWSTDLDSLVQIPPVRPLDWDGQVLRMTRRSLTDPDSGLLVIGWSTRVIDGRNRWVRWQSPALRTRGDLQNAWLRAAIWARNPSDEDQRREVVMGVVEDWQIFFFRGNAWSSPLSSDAAAPTTQAAAGTPAVPGAPVTPAQTVDTSLPDGVRLVLGMPTDHPLGGKLTLDWVRPMLSGGKS